MPGSLKIEETGRSLLHDVMEPVPRSPVGVVRRNTPIQGGPGVQYHRTMQRFVATKNRSCGLRGGRKPLLDFKIAGGRRRAGRESAGSH